MLKRAGQPAGGDIAACDGGSAGRKDDAVYWGAAHGVVRAFPAVGERARRKFVVRARLAPTNPTKTEGSLALA
jgi:hypothetical protein